MQLSFAALVAFLGGWTIGGPPAPVAASSSLDQTFGEYSFGDQDCTRIVDPVTVVFTQGDGTFEHVYRHAARSDHGGWDSQAGGQFFADDWGCSSADASAATNNGLFRDRYHMRYEVAYTINAGQAYAATPHYDDWSTRHLTHCVRPDGFTKARNDIYWNWHGAGGEHPNVYWSWWGNTLGILKCDGEIASSDGWVLYVDMRGTDAH